MSELDSLKNDGQNLPQLFKKGWKDFLEIEDSSEPSNSDSYQVLPLRLSVMIIKVKIPWYKFTFL